MNSAPLPMLKGYPQIVACGDSTNDIRYYYIRVENVIFPVGHILGSYYIIFDKNIKYYCSVGI